MKDPWLQQEPKEPSEILDGLEAIRKTDHLLNSSPPQQSVRLSVFFNPCEQICLLLDQSGSKPGYEMEHFLSPATAHVGFEERP